MSCSIQTLTLILGVHRSGTSMLTQGLRALGAKVGVFNDNRDPDNPEGYVEHPTVLAFNDRLLAYLGVSWDNWGFRAGTVDWDDPTFAPWCAEAVAILRNAYVGPGPFVLKDPRCATLVPFWERAVPKAGFDLRRILILRDPVEVAESQRQRVARRPHEFPVIADAEPMAALWAVTMTECLAAVTDDATLVVGHAGLLADPATTLAEAATFAGLAPDAASLRGFAADGIKPELYRARQSPDTGRNGPWMQAARALFADLARSGLPRRLSATEAQVIATAQPAIAALLPGLTAVCASISRMQAVAAAPIIPQQMTSLGMAQIKEPQLTLPPAEAAAVRNAYEAATTILEYGSGGSTVLASRLPDKRITSVESSADWIGMMKGYLAQSPGLSPVTFHHGDIGPTREWGYPKDEAKWRMFIDYPFSVWERHLSLNPDLVLIDGRFRMGCFIATLMNIRRPCTILFDDYGDRPYYHVVERLLPRSEMIGRMARFEARPGPHTALSLAELVRLAIDPR